MSNANSQPSIRAFVGIRPAAGASTGRLERSSEAPVHAAQLQFGHCQLYFYPALFAWTRIQGLHRAAQLAGPDGDHLPPAQARAAFQTAIDCAMGQFLVIADANRLSQFDHLLDAIAGLKSFMGLATPFLSGLNTAAVLADGARVGRAAQLWSQYGATTYVGSALTTAYLVDSSTKSVIAVSAANLKALAPRGANASILYPANIRHLSLQLQNEGLVDIGVAQDGESECTSALKLGGAIVGTIIGGLAAGGGGAAAGFGVGATVGDIVGGFVCSSQGSGDQSSSGQGGDQSTGGDDGDSHPDQAGGDQGGMPNPDDPHGFPDPNDPHGLVGSSTTYMTAGASSLVTSSASGVWTCHGVPQLTSMGGLASAGALVAIPEVAAMVGAQALNTANSMVLSPVAFNGGVVLGVNQIGGILTASHAGATTGAKQVGIAGR